MYLNKNSKVKIAVVIASVLLLATGSYWYINNQNNQFSNPFENKKSPDTLYVVTLGKFKEESKNLVVKELAQFYQLPLKVLPSRPLYKNAKNPAGRYTAAVIIDQMREDYPNLKGKLIGLTEVDITMDNTTRNAPYWGIMGLANLPRGVDKKLTTCVVSVFRMKINRNDRLAKVAIHEVGHTFSLLHCTFEKHCIMEAANGSGKVVDNKKKQFCQNCLKKYKNSNQMWRNIF